MFPAALSILPIPVMAVLAVMNAEGKTLFDKIRAASSSTITLCPHTGQKLDSWDSGSSSAGSHFEFNTSELELCDVIPPQGMDYDWMDNIIRI